MADWTITPDWKGEDAFIVAGGTSVTQEMVDSIKGRHTIVVNSSYVRALWADILFFGDERWWTREVALSESKIGAFKGIIATTSKAAKGARLHRLKRIKPPPGISNQPGAVVMERTSLQAAMNIAYHRQASRIILLGADNRDGDNGRIHHHAEYPWARHHKTWDVKAEQLQLAADPLERAGITVINCSKDSALDWWPYRPLADVLNGS